MTENSSPDSVAPQNVTFFSDGNVLRDIGKIEGRLDGVEKSIPRQQEGRVSGLLAVWWVRGEF